MCRTTSDLDEKLLDAAARELGTTSDVDTVNAALAYVIARRRRCEAFEDVLVWGTPDLGDPEVRASARR